MNKISGITFIHNGIEFDYCFIESILSMLGVCDEVVVVESESTDGTREEIERLKKAFPQIRIIDAPWRPAPLDQALNVDWTRDLGELARAASRYPYLVYLQADEVLHEKNYQEIRERAESRIPYYVNRYNFWHDTKTLLPHGKACGHWICRLGPRSSKVCWGSESLDTANAKPSSVGLYHYGYLRNPKAYIKKAEIMLPAFCGSMDPRVYKIADAGWKGFEQDWPDSDNISFDGTHPAVAKEWLTGHGL